MVWRQLLQPGALALVALCIFGRLGLGALISYKNEAGHSPLSQAASLLKLFGIFASPDFRKLQIDTSSNLGKVNHFKRKRVTKATTNYIVGPRMTSDSRPDDVA